jgi:hypothetical protein
VDNLEMRVLVEVLKASSDAVDDPVPLLPVQLPMSTTEEDEVEAPVGDDLVKYCSFLILILSLLIINFLIKSSRWIQSDKIDIQNLRI